MCAIIRFYLILLLIFLSVGCTSWIKDQPPAPVTQVESDQVSKIPVLTLSQILKLLETGQASQAKTALETYRLKHPKQKLAQRLYRQITDNPESRYGKEYFIYSIKRGDTLGHLAQRYLGDSMEFYGLARYNNIQDPRNIRVGQTIKIPLAHSKTAHILKQSKALFNQSQWNEGFEHLLLIPSSDPLYKQAQQQFVDGINRFYDSLTTADARQKAEPLLQQLLSRTTVHKKLIKDLLEKLQFEIKLEQSQTLFEAQRLEEAFEQLVQIKPKNDSDIKRYQSLADELSEALHRDAVIRFRNQQLESAIQLWNKVLAISPNHQSAKQYRDRALKLNAQLKQIQ
jgi:LysM repeat protein